jgi:ABC-2 type transport system permease protein
MKSIIDYSALTLLKGQSVSNPFWIMVRKEISGHIRSWRFITLILLISLTFFGTMYVSVTGIRTAALNIDDPDEFFLYLRLLTTTDATLPSFHVFVSFLGPLLGISLGFDAMNSEQQSGTLQRVMAQPLYRDNLLLSKFVGALMLIGVLFLSLVMLMVGAGLVITGVGIEAEEVLRIFSFTLVCILYVGFWLSLAILLSLIFRQAATSALTATGVWLFFTVFYQIIISIVVKAFIPHSRTLSEHDAVYISELVLNFLRLAPSQLYTDATTTLLMPSIRSLGPITMEQMSGAIPSPLPFLESLMIVWPQVIGLAAATIVCFALCYYIFMRREIKG